MDDELQRDLIQSADWRYADKRAALIAAAAYCANSDVFSSRDVTEIAEKFLTWLEGT